MTDKKSEFKPTAPMPFIVRLILENPDVQALIEFYKVGPGGNLPAPTLDYDELSARVAENTKVMLIDGLLKYVALLEQEIRAERGSHASALMVMRDGGQFVPEITPEGVEYVPTKLPAEGYKRRGKRRILAKDTVATYIKQAHPEWREQESPRAILNEFYAWLRPELQESATAVTFDPPGAEPDVDSEDG